MNTATNKTKPAHSVFARDFAAPTRRALLKKGIRVIGICNIPAATGELRYANGTRGYELDDNGCFRIRTHAEVLALAGV